MFFILFLCVIKVNRKANLFGRSKKGKGYLRYFASGIPPTFSVVSRQYAVFLLGIGTIEFPVG